MNCTMLLFTIQCSCLLRTFIYQISVLYFCHFQYNQTKFALLDSLNQAMQEAVELSAEYMQENEEKIQDVIQVLQN